MTDELSRQQKIIPSATKSTHAPGGRFTFGWGKGVENGSRKLGTIFNNLSNEAHKNRRRKKGASKYLRTFMQPLD